MADGDVGPPPRLTLARQVTGTYDVAIVDAQEGDPAGAAAVPRSGGGDDGPAGGGGGGGGGGGAVGAPEEAAPSRFTLAGGGHSFAVRAAGVTDPGVPGKSNQDDFFTCAPGAHVSVSCRHVAMSPCRGYARARARARDRSGAPCVRVRAVFLFSLSRAPVP